MIADINFLPENDYKKVVDFLHQNYPVDNFEIVYHQSPFKIGYPVGYSLLDKTLDKIKQIMAGVYPEAIYRQIEEELNNQYQFDELQEGGVEKKEVCGYKYPQYDKLFNFLVANDYKFPKDKIIRYMESLDGEKRYIPYDVQGNYQRVKETDVKLNNI